jgi:hypothetical protein
LVEGVVSYAPLGRERDALDDEVDRVVRALERMPVGLVQALGASLELADERDGPFHYLGWALSGWKGEHDVLIHLRLRMWLTGYRHGDVDVLARLRNAEMAPWPQLRKALIATAAT